LLYLRAEGRLFPMKLALTVWEGRISPLFDSARMLLIADIETRRITGKHFEPFDCDSPFSRAERLDDLGVNVLICNGISSAFANLIEAHRIKIVPFAAGAVDEVLEAYLTGRLF
jgi:predicted Fe-Mo cluster-binding NifX family protein